MSQMRGSFPSHVGEVVSLMPLGYDTQAMVLSRSWTPALGDVLRLREDRPGQPSSIILLYGEQLDRVLLHPEPRLPSERGM